MLKLGTQTGSLTSHIQSRVANPEPKIGMGCTALSWTDRHAATIIKVSPSGKTITVQYDKATRTDANGMSESQSYEYERDPEGMTREYRLGKSGWRQTGGGGGLRIGERETYHDFGF